MSFCDGPGSGSEGGKAPVRLSVGLRTAVIQEKFRVRQGAPRKTSLSDSVSIERQRINAALKRYCELDKLERVIVYATWHEWLKRQMKRKLEATPSCSIAQPNTMIYWT